MTENTQDPRQSPMSSTIIDFHAAVRRITSDRVAHTLIHLAGDESIRVIEALASAIANSLRARREIDLPFPCKPIELVRPTGSLLYEDQERVAMIQSIARGALQGTLFDPTRGSNAFHRVETTPDWSRDIIPIAVFGPFIFYRI